MSVRENVVQAKNLGKSYGAVTALALQATTVPENRH